MGTDVVQHAIQHVAVAAPADEAGSWIAVEHATHRPVKPFVDANRATRWRGPRAPFRSSTMPVVASGSSRTFRRSTSSERSRGMEFLVQFDIDIPIATPDSERHEREQAEAVAAAALVEKGHLLRVWTLNARDAGGQVLGLYSADSRAHLDQLLAALPLRDWMHLSVTGLQSHPNDPGSRPSAPAAPGASRSDRLPEPRLSLVYRLEATLGQPVALGDTARGHRRIVPLLGGSFTGPELNGRLM